MKHNAKQTESQPQQEKSELVKALTAKLEKTTDKTVQAAIREKIRAVKSDKPITK
jgi:hypothetical protein